MSYSSLKLTVLFGANCYVFLSIVDALRNMEAQGPDTTFLFQFGLIRDAVTVPQHLLNLKTLKDLACDFVHSKVMFFDLNIDINNFCIQICIVYIVVEKL